jgi:hypothetical protein
LTASEKSVPAQSADTNPTMVRARNDTALAAVAIPWAGSARSSHAVTTSTSTAVAAAQEMAIALNIASTAPTASRAIFSTAKTRFSNGTSVARLIAVST